MANYYQPPSLRGRHMKDAARQALHEKSVREDQNRILAGAKYNDKTTKAELLSLAVRVGILGMTEENTNAEIRSALDARKTSI